MSRLRYDNPNALSAKRQVYVAYLDHGKAEASKVASRLGIKRITCITWICEFNRNRFTDAGRRDALTRS
jgi:hypothetical protein